MKTKQESQIILVLKSQLKPKASRHLPILREKQKPTQLPSMVNATKFYIWKNGIKEILMFIESEVKKPTLLK